MGNRYLDFWTSKAISSTVSDFLSGWKGENGFLDLLLLLGFGLDGRLLHKISQNFDSQYVNIFCGRSTWR